MNTFSRVCLIPIEEVTQVLLRVDKVNLLNSLKSYLVFRSLGATVNEEKYSSPLNLTKLI